MPYFLQHFSKNWVKTLVHGTLHKRLLISRRSTRFGGFSPNAILFGTFCRKLGQNPSARYFAVKVAYFDEIEKFRWFFKKCHTFCNILLKIGSKPQCTVLCTKSCLFRGDRQVLVVFQQMPYFLQHFSKNWVKTLVHGTLHKKVLISRRPTSFGGFSPNAILFATFCQKLGLNPSARYFAQKVAYFEEINKFRWFFTKCHTVCNIFLKIGSKPQCTVLCTKRCLFRGDRQVLVVFHEMPYFLQHFAKNWVKTLVHGTLHKTLLISRRSRSFGGFSQNAILFGTFC